MLDFSDTATTDDRQIGCWVNIGSNCDTPLAAEQHGGAGSVGLQRAQQHTDVHHDRQRRLSRPRRGSAR
ncbi:MAG: hypothetical protein WKF73_11320 [Nocardioidaceae bacterium]